MSNNLIGATLATFTVTLSAAVTEPVDVAWSTRDGTAKAGTDYEAANGVVTFLPGETAKQVQVTVYGQDDLAAPDKNFFIELSPPTNAVLGVTFIEVVITIDEEDGVAVLSLVVPQGERGLKGDPGLSAYEQAVFMGYEGTVEQWMQEEASASAAATRAEGYAADAAASAVVSEQKANEATTAVASTKQYVDSALSDLSTAANKFYPTLAEANADIANIAVNQPVTIGESGTNGGLWYKATAEATTLTKSAYDPLTQAKGYINETQTGFLTSISEYNINLDTVTQTLKITGGAVRANTSVESILLSAQEMPLPASSGAYRIELNRATGLLSPITMATPRTGNLIVGWLRRLSITDYYINGFDYVVNNKKLNTHRIGFLTGPASSITFDNTNSKLVIGSSTRLVVDTESYLVSAQEVVYPTGGTFNLIFTKSTGLLSWQGAAVSLADGQICVGSYLTSPQTIIGIGAYNINGTPNTKINSKGTLIGADGGINFDWNAGKLIINSGTTRLLFGDATYLIGSKNIDLPPDVDDYYYRVTYDPLFGTLAYKRTSVELSGNEVEVGYFNRYRKQVFGIANYYVNGQPAVAGKSDLLAAELIVVNGNTDAGYVQSDMLSEYATFLSTATHTEIYALYDALVTAYPEYVSSTLLGNDSTGLPIYRYDFKAPEVDAVTHSGYLPKMILVSGVHGFEKAGIMNLYNTLKSICDNWQSNERLETLRWNCHFIVVPLAVPYGFNNHIRKNANGVDIARNFTADWVSSDPSEITYGGASPLSELEAQYLNAVMSENKDAIYFCSHHNFGGAPDPAQFVWNASATKFGVRLGKMLVSRLTHSLKKRYPWVGNYPNYIGISNINSPNGSEGKQATKVHGIQGGTFEIGDNLQFGPDQTIYGSLVATIGVEVLVNWLLLNLEYGADLYNSKTTL